MYIPIWLIIIGAIVVFWIYQSTRNKGASSTSVDNIENSVQHLKQRIFQLEHFDSPHFIDVQNAFDAMEINYFRLKQRLSANPEKSLEIAQNWYRYVEALYNLKFARIMLDVDWSDDAWDNAGERMKEPSIIKEEIEKQFEPLLGKDWQKIPDDYFKRQETMKKPKNYKKNLLGEVDWKYYYLGETNLYNLDRKRRMQEEEKKKNAQNEVATSQA